ncbi:Arginase/deacetylase [Parathielavia appendiculata]|uniref:Arginase/deacetylase n=1 Tax=Parathielavia appendiculata TaxID=2587402 RepID=A0AAN6Z6E4_9PEZI|nr:Arginase/deacetylase [Parathielavia appendiculata]
MSAPRPSPNNEGQEGDGDLAQSLKRLTITTSSPAETPRSPRPAAGSNPLKPVAGMSPSSPRPSNAMRSPLRSSSASIVPSSRSATPTLLRKASMNSLHSANGVPPSRRPSTAGILSPSRPRSGRSPFRSMSPEPPETPIPTPHSVASSHFKVELEIHHGPEPTRRAETVVILQDACYGHRYSRPRASRAQLSTIVERPERIKACVLGVSAAYVRLGERHQDGAFPLHLESDAGSLPSIPFRIQKSTRRLSLGSQTVTNVHGTKWMEELKIMCDTAEAKLAGGGKELQRPDMDRGLNAETPQKFHEGDLYLCSESLEAIEGALGGVCDAVDAVFRPQGPRRAFVAIRPPGHHCSATHPSGFCWINNVHVGIMHAVLSHGLTHAAIIDFDLHHGDGSQSIAWQHNARGVGLAKNAAWWKKTSIGYFSLHDINSYPCEMGDEDKVRNASICIDNAHGQSIWNVHLQPWKTEADFWALYESKYAVLLEKTRAYLKSHTERLRASGLNSKAAIFLSAGFDASEYEDPAMQRHHVNVPTEFYARFARDVVRIAAEDGTSVEGRIISVLEGGYSDRALCSGVFSHLCGLAGDGPSNKDQEYTSSASETSHKPAQQRARKDSCASERGIRRYESSWWSAAELDKLEATLAAAVPVPRPVRNSPPPTYSSPTQASQAKVVNLKNRRSVSGLSSASSIGVPRVFFEPPPPPDVPWTVAALELSKLLIPTERQTTSCTAEELNAEATKIRRERQAALAGSLPPNAARTQEDRPPTRMGLRERKPKPLPVEDDVDRKSRRKTVAGPGVLAAEGASGGPGKQARSSRRLSVASTVVSSEGLDSGPPVPPTVPIDGNSTADVASMPESSTGVAAPSGSALNVKKTRAPAKKEAIPRAPKTAKKPTTTTTCQRSQNAFTGPTGAASFDKTGSEIDKLAGEMKKIKITVVTKAQKEARERERLARGKLSNDSKTETASVPSPPLENKLPLHPSRPSDTPTSDPSSATAADTQHLPSPTPSPAPAPHTVQTPIHPSTPSLDETPIPTVSGPLISPPMTDPRRVPLPASSPPPPPQPPSSSGLSSPIPEVPAVAQNAFIPYLPDGPPPVSLEGDQHYQQKPLQWLPPNVCATPIQGLSPVKRGDLPVFTSTGVIPFAPSPSRPAAGTGTGTGEAAEAGGVGAASAGSEKRVA